MSWLRLLCIACLTITLCHCATTPESPAAQNQSLSWQNRALALSKINQWKLKAAIAIQHAQDAVSANLQWQQQTDRYHIVLFGPLGTSSFELTGQPGKVELATANGQHFVATSPEVLLAQQTGWQLPVSHLTFWVRGLPVPNMPSQTQFDAYHHLLELKQQDWTIQYLRYTDIHGIDLPNKITLSHPALKIKIVISQWLF